jgi:hypothetical protein
MFDLQTRNGKIRYNDLEFTSVTERKNEFKGTLKEGEEIVKIQTTNGKITIDKK